MYTPGVVGRGRSQQQVMTPGHLQICCVFVSTESSSTPLMDLVVPGCDDAAEVGPTSAQRDTYPCEEPEVERLHFGAKQ